MGRVEEWKRKREIGWSGKTAENFECNSQLIWARCTWRGCVCPLAREERSGLSGSSQAPPAGRSGAAQGLTARGPQESATEAKNTQRDRRLKSRERDHDFLPGLLFSPPSSLFPPSPHPSRVEVSLRPTGRSSSESSFPRSLPLASLTPTPRQARRSRRRGRWRRPPAPAGPRGRFEEPERPTEASREDAAAEDEPAERAVSPVSVEADPVRKGSKPRVGAWSDREGMSGASGELLRSLPSRRRGAARGICERGRSGHTHGFLAPAGRAEFQPSRLVTVRRRRLGQHVRENVGARAPGVTG